MTEGLRGPQGRFRTAPGGARAERRALLRTMPVQTGRGPPESSPWGGPTQKPARLQTPPQQPTPTEPTASPGPALHARFWEAHRGNSQSGAQTHGQA